MKTLLINAHPNFENQGTFTSKLQRLFVETYNQTFENDDLTQLNLYEIPLPRIEEGQLMSIWQKRAAGEPFSPEERLIEKQSSALLDQFKTHQRIVIVSPLHNFNVPSRMKDYMDNILIARETFKYTETSSVGLMTDDYKALFMQASGSIYTNDDRYTPLDFSHLYLKGMFEEIMGFDSLEIVRAQGTALLTEEEIWHETSKHFDKAFDGFYV